MFRVGRRRPIGRPHAHESARHSLLRSSQCCVGVSRAWRFRFRIFAAAALVVALVFAVGGNAVAGTADDVGADRLPEPSQVPADTSVTGVASIQDPSVEPPAELVAPQPAVAPAQTTRRPTRPPARAKAAGGLPTVPAATTRTTTTTTTTTSGSRRRWPRAGQTAKDGSPSSQTLVPVCGDEDGSEQPVVYQCGQYTILTDAISSSPPTINHRRR
jgi:hypothetical protein